MSTVIKVGDKVRFTNKKSTIPTRSTTRGRAGPASSWQSISTPR